MLKSHKSFKILKTLVLQKNFNFVNLGTSDIYSSNFIKPFRFGKLKIRLCTQISDATNIVYGSLEPKKHNFRKISIS